MEPSAVTPEMEAFFASRTKKHIDQVVLNLQLMEGFGGFTLEELEKQGKTHDETKYQEPERTGYIWLSWYYRCVGLKIPFEYPPGVEEKVKQAIDHHLTHNLHHAESHSSPDDMSDIEIVEMVCDWTAIAQEMGNKSCKGWVDANIDKKWKFSSTRKDFVYRVIDEIDKRIQAGSKNLFDHPQS